MIHSIDLIISLVVGHIVQESVQISHERDVSQIAGWHDVETACGGDAEYIGIHHGSSQEGVCTLGVGCARVCTSGFRCESYPILLKGIKSNDIRQCSGVADLLVNDIGRGIHGVVVDLQQETGTIDALQAEVILGGFSRKDFCFGASGCIGSGAAAVIQHHASNILVIFRGDCHHIILDDDRVVSYQFGCGIVDDHGDGQCGAFTQSIPIDISTGIHVIFWGQGHGSLNPVALISLRDVGVKIQTGLGIVPDASQFIEESTSNCSEGNRAGPSVLCEVMYLESGASGVPNGGEHNGGECIAVNIVEGVALGHIGRIRCNEISPIGIEIARMGGVSDAQAVGVNIA